MKNLDEKLRQMATAEDTPVPDGFDRRLADALAALPGGARRLRRGVKLVLIAACLCAAVVGTTVAVSPTLRGQLAALLGDFSPYVQPVDPSSDTWDGIQLTAVSAMMDDHVLKVYVQAKDLEGDRLASLPIGAESSDSFYNVDEAVAGVGTYAKIWDPMEFDTFCRCLSYDRETGIALLEASVIGAFADVPEEQEIDLYVNAIYPEGWTAYLDEKGTMISATEGRMATWILPLTVERLEINTYRLDQTLEEGTELLSLKLSAASATLEYIVREEEKNSPAGHRIYTFYLSDGTVAQGIRAGGHGTPNNTVVEQTEHYYRAYEDGEREYTTWTATYLFDRPLDIEKVVGVNIRHWCIPLNDDGTAGEAYWRYK